ncbi:hypothetical protein SAMN05421770_10327 [Granulicella rosea]|uniref:Uncharacterized protein n=1 Tax=Granulicella rosea TaxID=474952 RepID=A0A239IAU0_9BACT|nr:hypothetical protein SAMN05421770_10327 [Granulicella rosea]
MLGLVSYWTRRNIVTHTIEVEIDAVGVVRPLESSSPLPRGRALLTWQTSEVDETLLLSEAALAEDWLRPEEDEAWAYLQPAK